MNAPGSLNTPSPARNTWTTAQAANAARTMGCARRARDVIIGSLRSSRWSRVRQRGEQRVDDPLAIDVEEVVDALAVRRVAEGVPRIAGRQRRVASERELAGHTRRRSEARRVGDLRVGQVREAEPLGLLEDLGERDRHPLPGS